MPRGPLRAMWVKTAPVPCAPARTALAGVIAPPLPFSLSIGGAAVDVGAEPGGAKALGAPAGRLAGGPVSPPALGAVVEVGPPLPVATVAAAGRRGYSAAGSIPCCVSASLSLGSRSSGRAAGGAVGAVGTTSGRPPWTRASSCWLSCAAMLSVPIAWPGAGGRTGGAPLPVVG